MPITRGFAVEMAIISAAMDKKQIIVLMEVFNILSEMIKHDSNFLYCFLCASDFNPATKIGSDNVIIAPDTPIMPDQ